ncbi:hypothetical protein HGRIS_002796 [Hohenbuehelia grisea]|uniref:F-box domain-containing protein n=1 Tax=Hohenbuehelia grisea TaxID=104357 RepID=A0ABR3JM32_9AGAR
MHFNFAPSFRSKSRVAASLASLPRDLLLEVAGCLNSRLEILNLSLISRRHYSDLSSALYSTVVLNSVEQCTTTLGMLRSRADFARHVLKLVIRPESKPGKRRFGYNDGLASAAVREVAASMNLDALATFVWDGDEMPGNDDMWFALRMFCPRLRFICTTIGSILPKLNSHLFDFADLTGFSLTLKQGFYDNHVDMFLNEDQPASRKFWDMLINRCPNLEELSIDGISSLPTDAHSLVNGRWPKLRKLTLGDVSIDWHPTTINLEKRPFISFLEEHSSIRSLSLSRHNIQSNHFAANPVTFTHLTEFSGTLEQLQVLPHLHASLQSVSFRDPMQTRELTPLAVVGVLQSMSSLTHLRISFVLHSMYDSGSLLRSLIQSCPHLQHLDLTCAHKPSFHLDSFSKTIRSFRKLRTLSLTIVKYPGDESISAGAARIARTHPRLQKFTLTFLPPTQPLPLPFAFPLFQVLPPCEATGTYTLTCDQHGLPLSLTASEHYTRLWPWGLGASTTTRKYTRYLRPPGYPSDARRKRRTRALMDLVFERSSAGEEMRMILFCAMLVGLAIWGFASSRRVPVNPEIAAAP